MERLFLRVADATGKMPKVTYCLTSEFITDRLDEAIRLQEAGNEIGVHSHLPGGHRKRHSYSGPFAFRFDEQRRLNQDKVAGPLREILIALGFPAPTTHASGMFSFQQKTISILSDAGFTIDTSLIPNGKIIQHDALADVIIADNRRRTSRKPYRASLTDPWVHGDAPVLEIPVSGNLGCAYFGMDWAASLDDEFALVERRSAQLNGVDIYQSYWHHFEFSRALSWTRGSQDSAYDFLTKCTRLENVVFSTAREAADAWVCQESCRSGAQNG
jgi:hypothetical protein